MSNDVDIDDLVNEHKDETEGGRTASEAPTESETDDTLTLEDAIADAYADLENDDLHSNLTLRDENLAALFAGLDDTGELERIGEKAAEKLERDTDPTTKADVLRLLVRVGLESVDNSTIAAAKDGRKQFLESQTDEF